ncbi:hypothetical protein [Gelidibacter pelagius]|uniref:Uncharacterized protein n=1 Tax=Gelidibacter pelagius TaxID=2819985 RepID=A0ABS3SUS8_9FLAO|nr:hypothetical protein [Gelidibacter pelagius]MBO3099450.1 hypothetical protein [Gelidibacter pelagius]
MSKKYLFIILSLWSFALSAATHSPVLSAETENRTHIIELKNWKKVTGIAADESSQFFQYIKSKNEFRYYFNHNAEEAKLAFQNIFKNPERAKELWNLNPEFFRSLNDAIKDFNDLIELAEDGTLINYINWVY